MRLLVPIVALVVIAGLARAEDCQQGTPELTLETPLGTYYVDNDMCQLDPDPCLFSIWIYEESNGQPGLQRHDDFCLDHGSCCEPDTIIF